jgi:hypothetical protein
MLRLGTETGSLINHLDSRCSEPEPAVGMQGTVLHWTDRSAIEVIAVSKNRKGEIFAITVRALKAVRTDENGMSESQAYRFESMPESSCQKIKRNRKGEFRIGGSLVRLGEADAYYDYSF